MKIFPKVIWRERLPEDDSYLAFYYPKSCDEGRCHEIHLFIVDGKPLTLPERIRVLFHESFHWITDLFMVDYIWELTNRLYDRLDEKLQLIGIGCI